MIATFGMRPLHHACCIPTSIGRTLQVYGAGVWASLALMCASALCGSLTDLAFDLEGYLWQLVNCLFTASYSLYLRGVMDRVVGLTVNKTRLDEFSMVRLLSPQRSPGLGPGQLTCNAHPQIDKHDLPALHQRHRMQPHPGALAWRFDPASAVHHAKPAAQIFCSNVLSLPLLAVLTWRFGKLQTLPIEPCRIPPSLWRPV